MAILIQQMEQVPDNSLPKSNEYVTQFIELIKGSVPSQPMVFCACSLEQVREANDPRKSCIL